MTNRVKVAITGAAGQIGYALLFRIASGQAFGPDTEVEFQLLELPQAMGALEGVVMELNDCAFPLLRNIKISDDVDQVMAGVNWAVLVGAVPRKAGMERSDLLKVNGAIFTKQGRAINDHAADDVNVFVVGNPCNTNCLIARENAPDVPKDRFYAMTMLDELRARYQLAAKAGVVVRDIKTMNIWGNHSSTQFPDFYHATIAGKPAAEVISDDSWLKESFIPRVQKRGAEVIQTRGASSAASAANAALQTLYHLSHDTLPGERFSVALSSKGEYGVPEGLIFSYPVRMEQGKLQVVEGIEHNQFALEKIQLSIDELAAERQTVEALELISTVKQ